MDSISFPRVIVSGMRPTGLVHIGHYHGVIENWVRLQDVQDIERRYFFIADWHCLTTEYDNTAPLQGHIREMILDWLAFGVDPNKATVFIQSHVPQHAELFLLFSMMTPVGWLERVPSYKDVQSELTGKDLSTYGFLGYPLLQTADVAIYHGTDVPVGQDQVAHIELSREIVRRFHFLYGECLPEPQPLLTKIPKLPGTDGRKMSKSYNNSIALAESWEQTQKKLLGAVTDPARKRRTDPGNPDVCPVFDYHRVYSDQQIQAEIRVGCTSAGIGCIDCKKKLLSGMQKLLEPARERRLQFAGQKDLVADILATGANQARDVAQKNLGALKEKMKV